VIFAEQQRLTEFGSTASRADRSVVFLIGELVKYLIVVFGLNLWVVSALGGSWSSSGGELFRDARNPWFIRDTEEVSYCVQIDEEHFGASKEQVSESIKVAIAFWQREFTNAPMPTLPDYGPLKLAGQRFIEKSCGQSIDLSFQFGVLSQEQHDYLVDPTKYAAVTVRTNYNEDGQMRAKGFIYVSPANGPLAYHRRNLQNTEPWQKGNGVNLQLALVHELGHVFGLPHNGGLGELMSETFLEGILHDETPPMSLEEVRYFTLSPGKRKICHHPLLLERLTDFFGYAKRFQCIQVNYVHEEGNTRFGNTHMQVYAAESLDASLELVGTAELLLTGFFPQTVPIIWIPERQEVFTLQDIAMSGIAMGVLSASSMLFSKSGTYRSLDGKTQRNVIVQFEQGSGRASGMGLHDGVIQPNLF
jgi:hypothetical protein